MKDAELTLDSPGITLKTCIYCSHRAVCAIYDAFMDADISANDFNVLTPGYDDRIYEVLADNCFKFAW